MALSPSISPESLPHHTLIAVKMHSRLAHSAFSDHRVWRCEFVTTHRTVTLHHTHAARNRGLISYEHVTFSDQISNHCHANPATAIFVVCVALRRDVYGVARPRPAAAAESNMCGRGNGLTSILHRRQQCCYKFLTVDPIYPTQLELLMHRVRLCRRFDSLTGVLKIWAWNCRT